MARFDVYRLAGLQGYALDCQADWLEDLSTRLVVPLQTTDVAPPIITVRFNPAFDVGGEPVRMVTQFAAALPRRQLGPRVANLRDGAERIVAALDLLVTGV